MALRPDIWQLPGSPRGRSAAWRVLLACLYVCIITGAAWHAPHFARGETAVGVDGHAHHEVATQDSCALCTFASGSALASGRAPVPVLDARKADIEPARTTVPVAGFVLPGAARGPPSFS